MVQLRTWLNKNLVRLRRRSFLHVHYFADIQALSITCEAHGLTVITRPTIPLPVTTGMFTATPELLPRLIVIVLNQTEGSRAITRAGILWMLLCSLRFSSVLRRSFSALSWRALFNSSSAFASRSLSCSFSCAVLR